MYHHQQSIPNTTSNKQQNNMVVTSSNMMLEPLNCNIIATASQAANKNHSQPATPMMTSLNASNQNNNVNVTYVYNSSNNNKNNLIYTTSCSGSAFAKEDVPGSMSYSHSDSRKYYEASLDQANSDAHQTDKDQDEQHLTVRFGGNCLPLFIFHVFSKKFCTLFFCNFFIYVEQFFCDFELFLSNSSSTGNSGVRGTC